MLFSNTLQVDAVSGYEDIYYTHTFSIPLVATDNGSLTIGSGSTAISISTRNVANYSYHFKIPFNVNKTPWSMGGSPSDLLRVYNNISSVTVSRGSLSNIGLYDDKGNLLLIPNNNESKLRYMYVSSIHTTVDGADMGVTLPYILEFDWTYSDSNNFNSDFPTESFTLNVNVNNLRTYITPASADEIIANTPTIVEQNSEIIKESTQAIETSVTSESGGGLLATIKNFFGGFFSNLINSILGLFVPDSTYFSTWFDNLNTLLSDKLGMLYAPFDLLISTLNAIYSADTTEPGITFPGITWNGETVIEPYTFYFSSLGEDFQNLRDAVYFGTDVVLLFAFLHLLQKKIALVITGSEVNG